MRLALRSDSRPQFIIKICITRAYYATVRGARVAILTSIILYYTPVINNNYSRFHYAYTARKSVVPPETVRRRLVALYRGFSTCIYRAFYSTRWIIDSRRVILHEIIIILYVRFAARGNVALLFIC